MNMSYCRFRNTRSDLLDCRDALRELAAGNGDPLDREELDAAAELVRLCASIIVEVDEYARDSAAFDSNPFFEGWDIDGLESDKYLEGLGRAIRLMARKEDA